MLYLPHMHVENSCFFPRSVLYYYSYCCKNYSLSGKLWLSCHPLRSRMQSKSSKGDALAIAEAYRRKRRREAIDLHEDEVQKAKKFTEIINEQGSKCKGKKSHLLDVSN